MYARLLTHIFSIAIILHIAEALSSCLEVSKSCKCTKSNRNELLELNCPNERSRNVLAKYSRSYLEVTCYNNSLTYLSEIGLNTENVKQLRINNCLISNEFFKSLNELRKKSSFTKLVLSRNNIEDVKEDVLNSFLNMESVEIRSSKLKNFPNISESVSKVYSLNFEDNLIKKLPDQIQFSSLVALKLANNHIDSLNERTFLNTRNLRTLDLSNNTISILPSKLLHSTPNLVYISLKLNRFHSIPEDFFAQNPNLIEVDLNDVQLDYIEQSIFANLTKLKTLRLGNNSLETLPNGSFSCSSSLKYLHLSFNRFACFPEAAFNGLKQLSSLYFSRNKLIAWLENYNTDMENLEVLELKYNQLQRIEERTFIGLYKLQKLYLDHNKISEIHKSAFVNLEMLEVLNLSHNKLVNVADKVDVPHYFDIGMLGHLISKKCDKIDLSYNKITYIDIFYLQKLKSMSPRNFSQTSLKLFGNPIKCNCEVYDLLKYLNDQKGNSFENRIKIAYNGDCYLPFEPTMTKLKSVDVKKFTCQDVRSFDCPKGCKCKIRPFAKTLEVDCSNASFVNAPILPSLEKSASNMDIRQIWMNLENNLIEEFIVDYNYENVTLLNLANNKLRKMAWLPPNIEVLNLHNNRLSNFNNETLTLLANSKTLTQINLDGNNWICDCETVPLAKLLRTKLLGKVPYLGISCTSGSLLIELDEEQACVQNMTLIIILVTLSSLGVLLSIIVLILYFKYEHYVKIWLYNHKLLQSLIKEDDLDQDKKYDAFISYSHKNEEFVAKYLVQELENGPEKYKLCLHGRDWIIGEFIPKQIVNSVQASRRTIIVLSKDFLESEWAIMEFKTAHTKSMKEVRNRLIIILYEDIDLNEVTDEELKAYLSTNTYVKWGDPWFWKKLKKALPSKSIAEKISKRKEASDIEKHIDT